MTIILLISILDKGVKYSFLPIFGQNGQSRNNRLNCWF